MKLRGRWLYVRDESRWRRLALAPLLPLSWLYGAVAAVHRSRTRRRATRLSCRVVSVGNLTVGGSGKTPAAALIAQALHRRGHKVVLATRGYGRRGREPVRVVSDGRFVRADLDASGDEPILLASRAPGVPVLVGRDRSVVGLRAISAFGADVLVLDDGFQHHRLARDADVLVVDGTGFGNGHVLPRGPLREPVGVLRDAHAVGVVDGPLDPADEAVLGERCPDAFRFEARRVPRSLRPLRGGPGESPEVLRGVDVGLLAGIARPASFQRTLEALGARVVAQRTFPDHHRYRSRDVAGLGREMAAWITTEKDAVKILPAWVEGVELRVLAIDLVVDDPNGLLDWLEGRLH